MTDPTIKISVGAVKNRIRRKLARNNQVLKMNRRPDNVFSGEWFIIQKYTEPRLTKFVCQYVDLAHAARDLGVLYGHEVIDDE